MAVLLGLAAVVPSAFADGPARPVRADFTIGIEDQLTISVWGESELDSMTVKVGPDGKITIPLVNDLYVEGFTLQEVRNEVANRLSNFIRDPNVTVMLSELNSYRIYVLGEVNGQGVLSFSRPTRLLQVVATAGGLTEYSRKRIVLIREVDGEEQRFDLDYKRVIEGLEDNPFLLPGDMLVVK
ncbi:hypothetical protein ABI59_18790 [Acidobacteria bacterium Mor1]|nr:hypothetical protein ABI59_18790 [Acidobacteria bacterium Mor1]